MKKRKSNNKKNIKKEEVKFIEQEIFNDFVVIEKVEKNDNKEDKNEDKKEVNMENKNQKLSKEDNNPKIKESKDDFLKNWIIFDNPFKKLKKSRFDDLFKELQNDSTKNKNDKTKEIENLEQKDTISKTNSSINLSSQITNYDSKIIDPISINDSLFDNNNNINLILEKKNVDEKKEEKTEELDLNVDINKIISLEDKRATIMIKNLPNKFNKDLLLSIINQNFKGTYDLFILPTDINKYKNFGYAFINFTSSYYIPYFYFLFNGKMWSGTNSKKVCELTYSKVQGKIDLLRHYPSKITYGNEEALNVTPEQKYIIPNVYKLVFNKFFPKEKIEEYKLYFTTKMPIQ